MDIGVFRAMADWLANHAGNHPFRRLLHQLQDEGAKSFVKSWIELMAVIESKSATLKKAS